MNDTVFEWISISNYSVHKSQLKQGIINHVVLFSWTFGLKRSSYLSLLEYLGLQAQACRHKQPYLPKGTFSMNYLIQCSRLLFEYIYADYRSYCLGYSILCYGVICRTETVNWRVKSLETYKASEKSRCFMFPFTSFWSFPFHT